MQIIIKVCRYRGTGNFVNVDFPLERKTPVVYEDGVYEIVEESRRGNVLVISNLTQHGLSGLGSARRTAFFTFFGMHNNVATQWVW